MTAEKENEIEKTENKVNATENETIDEDVLQDRGGEAVVPKVVRGVNDPTAAERTLHNKTHLPYRNWCKFCVMGRGRDLPHRSRDRTEDGLPIIGVDFFFIGEPSVETLMPAVVIRDSASKALFAHVIPGKGLDYDWTAQQVAADIGRMGYPRVVLRSDQEPAITAMVDRVKAIRDEQGKETDIEWAPKYDSDANGHAERGVQAAEGMLRTLKFELENKIGGRIPSDHPMVAWMTRHAADLITKLEIKQNGRTSYEMLKGRPYSGEVAGFGQKILFMLPKRPRGGDLQARWGTGIGLGNFGKATNVLYVGMGM